MKFIEDVTEIAALVLPQDDEDDEEAEPSTDKYDEIERLPISADLVAEYGNEIADSPHHSWLSDRSLFIVSVPGRTECYALLELDWDDNWCAWTWSCEAAVDDAPSSKAAEAAMLEKYARERLAHGGSSAYQAFLQSLLPAPSMTEPTEPVSKLSPAEELLRQTFGRTTPMQSGERVLQTDPDLDRTPEEKRDLQKAIDELRAKTLAKAYEDAEANRPETDDSLAKTDPLKSSESSMTPGMLKLHRLLSGNGLRPVSLDDFFPDDVMNEMFPE